MACSLVVCGCQVGDVRYKEGETWDMPDGCSKCSCTSYGQTICTLSMTCVPNEEPVEENEEEKQDMT